MKSASVLRRETMRRARKASQPELVGIDEPLRAALPRPLCYGRKPNAIYRASQMLQ
jgi:hypothetical protein